MIPPPWQILFLLLITAVFLHFLIAGARTFVVEPLELGAGIGQAVFFGGALVVAITGISQRMDARRGAVAALMLLCALALYEWARRTVRGRRFSVVFNDQVPDALCESGPYGYIRHPFYVSYMLAFAAAAVALPAIATTALLVCCVGIFGYAARSDERAIARSGIADAYALYKSRVGRFLPRPGRSRAGTGE